MRSESKSWKSFMKNRRRKMRTRRKKTQMKRRRKVKGMRTVKNKMRRRVLRKKKIINHKNLIRQVIQRLQKHQNQQRKMKKRRKKKRNQRKPKLSRNLCLDWIQKMKVMNQMLCQKLRLKNPFDLMMVRIHQDSPKIKSQNQLTHFSFKLKLLNLNLKLLKQSHLKTFMKN